jgi:predicted nucleotidyltransferase
LNKARNADLPAYDQAELLAVCRQFELSMVVLFGSRATGSPPPTEDSDIDLAVMGCDPRQRFECSGALSKVFAATLVDLILLQHDADPLLRYEIMQRGILLYGDADQFCDYRSYAYRDFVDSADLRALEQRLFEKKLEYLRGILDAAP